MKSFKEYVAQVGTFLGLVEAKVETGVADVEAAFDAFSPWATALLNGLHAAGIVSDKTITITDAVITAEQTLEHSGDKRQFVVDEITSLAAKGEIPQKAGTEAVTIAQLAFGLVKEVGKLPKPAVSPDAAPAATATTAG